MTSRRTSSPTTKVNKKDFNTEVTEGSTETLREFKALRAKQCPCLRVSVEPSVTSVLKSFLLRGGIGTRRVYARAAGIIQFFTKLANVAKPAKKVLLDRANSFDRG